MPQFPIRKAEKNVLYDAIVAGVAANPALYPSALGEPFDTGAMSGGITAKNTAVNTRQQEEGQFRAAVVAETGAYGDTDDEARRLLNLAIATHGVDSANLTLIGWGPRAVAQSNIPGQPRNLEAVVQGPGNVFLDWKAPAPGGDVGGEGARTRLQARSASTRWSAGSGRSPGSRRRTGARGRRPRRTPRSA